MNLFSDRMLARVVTRLYDWKAREAVNWLAA
jgi:hypothetical protein